jgi:hypothetical protein
MKKYLMTGMAAVLFCGAFTSCSHDDITSAEDISKAQAEQITKTYETAFLKYVGGEIGKNQTWGFGSVASARTRVEGTVNANMWADSGYDVPLELSPAQIQRVVAYFQNNKLTAGGSKDYTDFFVQQVYKGGTSPIGTAENGLSKELYKCANGEFIIGGKQMDYLTSNGGDHISNFNNGNYGSGDNGTPNSDVQNSPGVTYLYPSEGKPGYHTDYIQLMTGSLATNFGYGNSRANVTYNDKYVLVDGSVIDTWAASHGNVGAAVGTRAFVGFDFEQFYKDEDVYDGSFVFEGDGNTYPYIKNAPNAFCGDWKTFTDADKPGISTESMQTWLNNGYRPVAGNDKAWAKIEKCADGYFTDWIVCIVPAKTSTTTSDADLRIMAEDLSAEDDTDFDFNDIVFDVYFSTSGTTKIVVQAAGGTLPLRIWTNKEGDPYQEVHALWSDIDGISTGTMINTGAEARYGFPRGADNRGTREVTLYYSVPDAAAAKNIKIEVQKTTSTGTEWIEMRAEQAEPAAKFATDPDNQWLSERTSIKSAIPSFVQWVQGNIPALNWK